ncbi:DNA replication initiation control protein YabA [Fructilactobacillus sp. Tb1]|uniref:DNA replication initiation control protein YabA n=1 Tax=Fructilactobacillus sp. Tb1 TaxID=3422304 RepID=UPI003D2C1079
MDINEMNDGMDKLSAQFKQMVTKIGDLREQINAVLEENSELKIENEHLRDLLENSQNSNEGVQELSKSKKLLEKLYNQGFHVCNESYGKRRLQHESCIFCTQIIYGER